MNMDQKEFEFECSKVCRWLNEDFGSDPNLLSRGVLPMKSVDDMLVALADGVILCKIVNQIRPECVPLAKLYHDIDMEYIRSHVKSKLNPGSGSRRIETSQRPIFQMTQNANLFITGIAKIPECKPVDIVSDDVLSIKPQKLLIGMFTLYRCMVMANVRLSIHPNLVRLVEPGESLDDFMKLGAEKILVRWINFQCRKNGSALIITNLLGDLKDSEALLNTIKQIAPPSVLGENLSETLDIALSVGNRCRPERAGTVLECANKMGIVTMITQKDIMSAEQSSLLSLVAGLFNKFSNIALPGEDEIAKLEEIIRIQKVTIRSLEEKVFQTEVARNAMDTIDKLQAENFEFLNNNNRLEAEIKVAEHDKLAHKDRSEQLERKLKEKTEAMEIERMRLIENTNTSIEDRFREFQEKYDLLFEEKERYIDEIIEKANKYKLETIDHLKTINILQQQLDYEKGKNEATEDALAQLKNALEELQKDLTSQEDKENNELQQRFHEQQLALLQQQQEIAKERKSLQEERASTLALISPQEAGEKRNKERGERDRTKRKRENYAKKNQINFDATDSDDMEEQLKKCKLIIKIMEDTIRDLEDELAEERQAFDDLVEGQKQREEDTDTLISRSSSEKLNIMTTSTFNEANTRNEERGLPKISSTLEEVYKILAENLGPEVVEKVAEEDEDIIGQIKIMVQLLINLKNQLEIKVQRHKEIGDIMRLKVDTYVLEQLKSKKPLRQRLFH